MPTRRQTLSLALPALVAAGLTPAGVLAQSRQKNAPPEVIRRALEEDANAPAVGAAKPTAVLVEFFDYNCPYCRRSLPVLNKLLQSDQALRLVLREWPVFGEGSVFAARAALASRTQGKYWAFHRALLQMKERAAEPTVMRVARQVGLDEARLRAGMEEKAVTDHIAQSGEMADHFGLIGTPTFIVGARSTFGMADEGELQEMIADYRRP